MNTVKKKKQQQLRHAKNCKKSDSHPYKKKKINDNFQTQQ